MSIPSGAVWLRLVARRGLATQVPALLTGEIGYDTDAKTLRVGDDTSSPPRIPTTKATGIFDFSSMSKWTLPGGVVVENGLVDGVDLAALNTQNGVLVRTGNNAFAVAEFISGHDMIVVDSGGGQTGQIGISLDEDALEGLVDDFVAAALVSAALTGTPTAPTASPGTNTTQIATTAFVQAATSALIAAAPGALDTLNELAAALGNDANFSTTITNALANKQNLDPELTAIAGLTSAADKVPYFTGSGTAALADLTSFGRSLTGSANAAAAKTALSLAKADVGLGNVDNTADSSKSFTASQINNSTTIGRDILTAADAAAVKLLLSLAKADVGLGNVDNTADSAKSFTASQINNSTAVGRSILTAADAAAAKTALSLAKADVGLGNVDNTADSAKSFTASQINNSTAIGRDVLTAATQTAARAAIGVGAGTGDVVSTNNLSDLSNIATARDNLGIPNAQAASNIYAFWTCH